VEYFACLLTSVKGNLDRAAVYLAECRAMNIRVLNPDVNVSASDFIALDPEDAPPDVERPSGCPGSSPFGLSAVRNVGEGLVELVIREREKNGPFADFHDFVDRVDFAVLNKRTVESLIKAGAFDSLGHAARDSAHVRADHRPVRRPRRKEAEGQFDLFAELGAGTTGPDRVPVPDVEFDKADASPSRRRCSAST
jgi:DNA polymerase-3 subunit alpha